MINFALINPSDKLINTLNNYYGRNENSIDIDDLVYFDEWTETKSSRIIPPKSYETWIQSTEDIQPKAALVCSLFPEELTIISQSYQYKEATLVGKNYNDFKDTDFNSSKWKNQPIELTVGLMDKPGTPYHNRPVVQLNGFNLAPFSADSPKLPIGSTFKATITENGASLHLDIDSSSIQFPSYEQSNTNKSKLLECRQEDILNAKHGIIIQQVNCRGAMAGSRNGKPGLAQQIADKYPKVKEAYLIKHERKEWQLGVVQLIKVDEGLFVANLAGQYNYGTNAVQTDFSALRTGLKKLAAYAEKHNLPLLMPHGLGSGLAGGRNKEERQQIWQTVEQIIAQECPNAIIYNNQSSQNSNKTEQDKNNNQFDSVEDNRIPISEKPQQEHDEQKNYKDKENNDLTEIANQTLTALTHTLISEHPDKSSSLTKIDLSEIIDGWIMRVDNQTKKCYIQDRNNHHSTVFSINLDNQEIAKPLNQKNARYLIEQLTVFNQKQENNHSLTKKKLQTQM